MQPTAYFHPLNFLRFVLAMGVVLFHYGQTYQPFDSGWLNTLIVNSSFRVSFFFFISGFVMCLVYAPRTEVTAKEFYRRRLTRILPMFWLAFAVSMALILFVLGARPKGFIILLHALGLQTLCPGYVLDLNFTAWSISVELVFYAVFPFFLRWLLRLTAQRMMWWVTLLWILQSLQHVFFVEFVYDGTKAMEEFISTFPLWHLVTFIGGMATARIAALNRFPEFLRHHTTSVFFLSLAVILFIVLVPNPVLKYIHNGLLLPVFALLVLALYYNRGLLHRVLSLPAVSRLGDLSYAIFIFQYPLWVAVTALAGEDRVNSNAFFYLYLGVLIVFAWTMNRYFERPVLKWLREKRKKS